MADEVKTTDINIDTAAIKAAALEGAKAGVAAAQSAAQTGAGQTDVAAGYRSSGR